VAADESGAAGDEGGPWCTHGDSPLAVMVPVPP
jgi:hypothetical protein